MSSNLVPTELLLSKSHWLPAEELTERIISASLKAALQFKGLLTSALQEVYGEPVSVDSLRLSEWVDTQGALGLRRDVILKAGDIPCVAASSLMPADVINRHPWLASLGNRPLGEALEKRGHYQRSPYEFRQLDVALVFQPPPPTTPFAWARRYRFILAGDELQVMEVFFPGVLDRLSLIRSKP